MGGRVSQAGRTNQRPATLSVTVKEKDLIKMSRLPEKKALLDPDHTIMLCMNTAWLLSKLIKVDFLLNK